MSVGLDFLPTIAWQVLHVPEGQRPNRVVPVRLLHPQPVKAVPALFQGQHPLRVVSQLADQQDLQPIRGGRRIGPLAGTAGNVPLRRSDSRRGMHADWMWDLVIQAIWVNSTYRPRARFYAAGEDGRPTHR